MSRMFEKVKAAYDAGTWPASWVRNAVEKGWITAEECELITGEEIAAPETCAPENLDDSASGEHGGK